ncbi:MAG: glycine cleavage system protein GcvH [Methylophilaceae bacterium]|jgi:glycine cleavage system H protein|uniref:glycine cleavage system protein GcvH n=1 Tax=Methylobacillus sp. MM3 TaxID=1848039 RepID=UPI0007DE7F37|nr:glycine cleavage system protein GcvH [Methylobacillus sp. MM3]OAJ70235.1 glycine cleavage system protein H [Methylobacillus sp. MM3]
MSNIPADLKYAKTHEWSRLEADGTVTVGITDHAQYLLGDLVFIELPEPGKQVSAGKEIAVVESVKAASDIYAPLSGTISAVNQDAADMPERVNNDAYATWLFKIQPDNAADLDQLLDAAGYQQEIGE